jgi:hypothetical protein
MEPHSPLQVRPDEASAEGRLPRGREERLGVFKFYKAVPLNNWNPYALAVGVKREDSDDYDGDTTMYLMIHDDDDSTVRLGGEQLIILRDLLLEMCPTERNNSLKRMRGC